MIVDLYVDLNVVNEVYGKCHFVVEGKLRQHIQVSCLSFT